MKKIKRHQKVILILVIFLTIGYCFNYFVYRGNNRLTIWVHHGLWLPNSTTNINFYTYPEFINRLFNVDDWAKTELTIPKSELSNILSGRKYQYEVRVDTIDKFQWQHVMSGWRYLPDSVINGELPINLQLKSSTGDFLMFYAEEKTKDSVYVHLYTDWN